MMADRPTSIAIIVGILLLAVGLMSIFLFSTQVLVPAQPATPGHWEWRVIDGITRNVWYSGQPSQPEHFETSYPNLPFGIGVTSIGLVIFVVGTFLRKRAQNVD